MKFLTVLFKEDGTYFGTQGHERPLPDSWMPPPYTNPGETQVRRLVAVHLGAAELSGTARCVSTDLFDAIESHPASTSEAPKFGIKDMALMPQIYDAPVALADFPAWMRANGPDRMPKALRAWLTLVMPDLAAQYRLDRDVSLEDMMAVEAKRTPTILEEHSRMPNLKAAQERQREEQRQAKFQKARGG